METFAKMKPGSYLLNTARGQIVDEVALIRAIDSGQVAGAGLDVFENEPGITPGLLDEDRVVLMPHAGSATLETRREMARLVVEDVRRVLSGEKPLHPVPMEKTQAAKGKLER
jgi:glyoxylate reductase